MTANALPLETFATLASAFCAWSESDAPRSEMETTAAVWLARLHAAALLLPVSEPDSEEENPGIPLARLALVERNFMCFAGEYYRVVFDPNPLLEDAPVMGDLGDDLLEVYKEIKAGCLMHQLGRQRDAEWHWRFSHQSHWGRHAVTALAALYARQKTRQL